MQLRCVAVTGSAARLRNKPGQVLGAAAGDRDRDDLGEIVAVVILDVRRQCGDPVGGGLDLQPPFCSVYTRNGTSCPWVTPRQVEPFGDLRGAQTRQKVPLDTSAASDPGIHTFVYVSSIVIAGAGSGGRGGATTHDPVGGPAWADQAHGAAADARRCPRC